MRRALLSLGVLVAVAGGALADPLEDGLAAYGRHDYGTALRRLRPLAEQGNAQAQYILGAMYAFGLRVPRNRAEALSWYRRAAERGNASAQYQLGLSYDHGLGARRNFVEAARWYRLAAAQGDAGAQTALAELYADGRGVPQDYAEAARWFRLAAEQGNVSAQGSLGRMYARGRGVPQDDVQAHMWLNLSAARSPPGDARDETVAERSAAEARMTRAQIAEAQRLAREWDTAHRAAPPR